MILRARGRHLRMAADPVACHACSYGRAAFWRRNVSETLNSQDQQFITSTSQDNISESTDGRLAEAQAGSLAVSIYGAQLVADHGFVSLQTGLAADRSGAALSTTSDPMQTQQTAQLQGLTGNAFDQQYLSDEVQGNQTSIINGQQELASGQNPSVQELNSLLVPFQEVHTSQAQLLQLSANITTAQPAGSGGVPFIPEQPLSVQDLSYINQAAQSGNDEIQLGQLAEQQTSNEAVGLFGRWMALDHTVLNSVVASTVNSSGVTPPTTLDASGITAATTLQNLTGTAFDQQYMANEVQSHIQTIYNTEMEINQGTDPALVSEANAALPLFQAHLAAAVDIGLASSLGATDAQAAPTTTLGQSIASIGDEGAQAIVGITNALTLPQNGALNGAVMSFLSQPHTAASPGANPFGPGTSDTTLAQVSVGVAAGAQALISIAHELTLPQNQGLGSAILGVLSQPQYQGVESAAGGFLQNPTGATGIEALAAIGSSGGALIGALQHVATAAVTPATAHIG